MIQYAMYLAGQACHVLALGLILVALVRAWRSAQRRRARSVAREKQEFKG